MKNRKRIQEQNKEDQEKQINKILSLLKGSGYLKVDIKSISMLDKVLGGLVYLMQHS